MSKFVYCSECGTKLMIKRKALKGYARIIDLIDPHICSEEVKELDLTPVEEPSIYDGEKKFESGISTLTAKNLSLSDRREKADIKTTAPSSLLEMIKGQNPSTPDKPITFNTEEED